MTRRRVASRVMLLPPRLIGTVTTNRRRSWGGTSGPAAQHRGSLAGRPIASSRLPLPALSSKIAQEPHELVFGAVIAHIPTRGLFHICPQHLDVSPSDLRQIEPIIVADGRH